MKKKDTTEDKLAELRKQLESLEAQVRDTKLEIKELSTQ